MLRSPIRLDAGCSGVVIYCAECGHWSAFRFTLEEAREVAIDHETRVHPGQTYHRNAGHVRASRARHAV